MKSLLHKVICSLAVIVISLSIISACNKISSMISGDEEKSEVKFTVLMGLDGFSVIPFLVKDKKIRVFINNPELSGQLEKQALRQQYYRKGLEDVANTWNNTLAKHPTWPLAGKRIDVEIVRDGQQNFTLDIFSNFDSYKLYKKLPPETKPIGSHAGSQRIVLMESEMDEYTKKGAPPLGILMHEYGHVLGLSDTYEAPDYQQYIGRHRSSVMRGGMYFEETRFVPQEDDKAGLWMIVNHFIDKKAIYCPENYVPYKSKYTFSKITMLSCVLQEDAKILNQPETNVWENANPLVALEAFKYTEVNCNEMRNNSKFIAHLFATKVGVACGNSPTTKTRECLVAVGNVFQTQNCVNYFFWEKKSTK